MSDAVLKPGGSFTKVIFNYLATDQKLFEM